MSAILFSISNNVGWIRFNRPEKFNAYNLEMATELIASLNACSEEESIRCVVITGTSKAFCSGQDLEEATRAGFTNASEVIRERYNPVVKSIREMHKPVIAAVSGVAAGAGVNFALCCDIVLASENASFVQAFSKIGLVPDTGGTYLLPRIVGWHRALALCLTGDKLTAGDAERIGMVYRVFSDGEMEKETTALAEKLAAMPTTALGLIKEAFNQSFTNNIEEQLNLEEELQMRATQTHDYREGITAFLEKRKPVFKGN